MSKDTTFATEEPGTPPQQPVVKRRRRTAALWVACVSLVITAVIFPLFPNPVFLPPLIVAVALGGIALLLNFRARSRKTRIRTANLSLILGTVALGVNVALIATMVIGVTLSRTGLTQVEVRAEGGPNFTVSFADDVKSYTEEWNSSGWKQFTTTQSSAEITVTDSPDGPSHAVSCAILWNGKIVVDESSTTGTVTCRYEK